MTKINQLIAVEKGVKAKFERKETDLFRAVQQPTLTTGITRTYTPKDEEGDKLPSEKTLVQLNAEDVLKELGKAAERLFDVVLTKESANAEASADIKVDGNTILSDVPVTYLLFLEKQLVNLQTFVSKLPTLDPAQVWRKDANTGVYVSEPVDTIRTKKVPKNWVKAEATDKHPAQVEIFNEDVIVGTWRKVDMSGAIPGVRKAELLDRLDKLQTAVKFAREEANSAEVVDRTAAASIFEYLFA